jgi:hypothetical protein
MMDLALTVAGSTGESNSILISGARPAVSIMAAV